MSFRRIWNPHNEQVHPDFVWLQRWLRTFLALMIPLDTALVLFFYLYFRYHWEILDPDTVPFVVTLFITPPLIMVVRLSGRIRAERKAWQTSHGGPLANGKND